MACVQVRMAGAGKGVFGMRGCDVYLICRVVVGVTAALLLCAWCAEGRVKTAAEATEEVAAAQRRDVEKLVLAVVKADYEGNRPELRRLFGELEPYAGNREIGVWVRYWRGFAMWRRVINGFNESVDAKEQSVDLRAAAAEFEQALVNEPNFVDAKLGAGWCLMSLSFFNRDNPASQTESLRRGQELIREAQKMEPENPRLLWILGLALWRTPPEQGGGQARSKEIYEKGLELARKQKGKVSDILTPTWGEPEMLMSLAWVNLNKTEPDLDTAERQAREALALVPHWHYVRDILMKQIREAKEKKK